MKKHTFQEEVALESRLERRRVSGWVRPHGGAFSKALKEDPSIGQFFPFSQIKLQSKLILSVCGYHCIN